MNNIDQRIEEEEALEQIVHRPRKREPANRYEYCVAIAGMIRKPVGYVLAKTKGWPFQWFLELQSHAKMYRTHESKIKFVQWFIKEAQTREK